MYTPDSSQSADSQSRHVSARRAAAEARFLANASRVLGPVSHLSRPVAEPEPEVWPALAVALDRAES